ncbi:alpha/beta hydrolase [Mycolicibacterium psychrotolerans]|uniref:Alpha/beta hydrolase fold-3 domain-containing protein n=1 Tax=Mycolicibacterium psychrotolerans TaxID=216929 RepID=A0A7I7MIQ6_9MYCO|nr:alpha/beta hydrolase [Mycolicibacterium psychrotolerans]BBX71667.1 hypothetical protein MPSYJ_51280 [Mycolicibacterium psychrotolerans]
MKYADTEAVSPLWTAPTEPPGVPDTDTTHAVASISGARSSNTAVIVRKELDTAATAVGPPSIEITEPAAAAPAAVSMSATMFFTAEVATATKAPPAPTTPATEPTPWTLLAFARRESEQAFSRPLTTIEPLATQSPTELLTDTTVVTSQLIDPVITGEVRVPSQAPAALVAHASLDITTPQAMFTGEPSIVSRVFTGFYRVLGAVGELLGVDITTPAGRLLSNYRPPWFIRRGLTVQRNEFEGMSVWTLQSCESTSEKTVVAVPGSAFVWPPTLFHWLNYAAMARNTGAAVVVPIYSVVPRGGTAGTVVPAIADLISSGIDQRGAENVSVYGDSLGGTIGLAAVQELVRRGNPVPSHMVLISPALDLTFSNPAIQFVDDPVFSGLFFSHVRHNAQVWAGGLDVTDPLVSPLFGSLAGLPPTALYFGSLEILAPDGLVLQDTALATPGADFTFILREGEIHIWAVNPILPETRAVLPDIYRQLAIAQ